MKIIKSSGEEAVFNKSNIVKAVQSANMRVSLDKRFSDADIKDLWKSKEMELMAKAAYEWKNGFRKKAFSDMSKASFRILIGEEVDDYLMSKKIREYTDEDNWKDFIIDIFCGLPDNVGNLS